MTIGTVESYPNDASARKEVQGFLLKLNAEAPNAQFVVPTFRALIDRYKQDEMPDCYSTRVSYESMLNRHIQPKWGDYSLDKIKPMAVEQWLRTLSGAPKTKGHIKALMHLLFRCAERWELVEMGKNPLTLVRVKGCSKRLETPRVLTVEEFWELPPRIPEPFRTAVIVDECLGLRASELMGLKWSDFNFDKYVFLVQRGVVYERVGKLKTDYSRKEVPLDPSLASILLTWRAQTPYNKDEDWVFANPKTGKPYHQDSIQSRHIKKAATAAGLGKGIGWKTFRHTYRSLLDETGAPLKVQQELMRHANIQTTMLYGCAMSETKRSINSKVAQMILKFTPVSQDQSADTKKGPLSTPSTYAN